MSHEESLPVCPASHTAGPREALLGLGVLDSVAVDLLSGFTPCGSKGLSHPGSDRQISFLFLVSSIVAVHVDICFIDSRGRDPPPNVCCLYFPLLYDLIQVSASGAPAAKKMVGNFIICLACQTPAL